MNISWHFIHAECVVLIAEMKTGCSTMAPAVSCQVIFMVFVIFLYFSCRFFKKYSKNSYNKTTLGTVQKWSLRPLLNSPKGGLSLEDTECRKHTGRMTDTF